MKNTKMISETFYKWLLDNHFKSAPASTKFHGNYAGGLYDHSVAVTKRLLELTDKLELKWLRDSSPYIVGMFHDLCKIDAYKYVGIDENHDLPWIHADPILKGHGEKSIILLSQFMTLTEEEILCIRFHMGAYQTEDWDSFDRAIKKYPNVLYTHTADMLASKLAV